VKKPSIQKPDGHRHQAVTIVRLEDHFWPERHQLNGIGCWQGHDVAAALVRWIEAEDLLILNCTARYGRGFPVQVSDQRGGKGTRLKCHTRDCRGFGIGLGPIEPPVIDAPAGYREFFEVQQGWGWAGASRATQDDAIGDKADHDGADERYGRGGRAWVLHTAPPVASRFRQVYLYPMSDQHADDLHEAVCSLNKTSVLRKTIRRSEILRY
jgi:hypothetical protein